MPAKIITSAFLIKLSKHGALLVCLFLLGRASNRYEVSQAVLLGLVIASALLHLAGRALQLRPVVKILRNGFQ